MKKFLSVTLCVLLLVSMVFFPSSASAAQDDNIFRDRLFIFEVVNDSEISILHYIGTDETVVVPNDIGGLPVTSIEKWAFFGTDVKEIVVSEGITNIGEEAFYNCQSLEKVTLPSTLEKTGDALFRFCQNLKDVTFAGVDSAPELGEYLFYACNSLESVNIPQSIDTIPEGMFAYCQNLESVNLPDSTEEIDNYAFYGSGLTSITLPENLDFIGNLAFADCPTLSEVNVEKEDCEVVFNNAFSGCPADNPFGETETKTIYFANLLNFKRIEVEYFSYTGIKYERHTDMIFYEKNDFGQDIYKAELPSSATTVSFNGYYDNGKTESINGLAEIMGTNPCYYPMEMSDITVLGIYTYSPDVNPLDFDEATPSTETTTESVDENIIRIYFTKELSWEDAYVYTFCGASDEEPLGIYPGLKMTYYATNEYDEEVYYADIPKDFDYIKFSDGSAENRRTDTLSNNEHITNDTIFSVYYQKGENWPLDHAPFVPDDPFFGMVPEESIDIYFTNNRNWENVYIYSSFDSPEAEVKAESFGTYPGTKMTYVGKNTYNQEIYRVKVPFSANYIVFSNGTSEERTDYISITDDIWISNLGFYLTEKVDSYWGYETYTFTDDVLMPETEAVTTTEAAEYTLELDSTVPPTESDPVEVSAKPEVLSVGSDVPDSGFLTTKVYLIGAPYPDVNTYEKGVLVPTGAKANEQRKEDEQKATNVRERGDANGDGKLNIKDATEIQKYKACLIKINQIVYKNCDANADGDVNIRDVTAIQRDIAGIEPLPD